jgi:hypothetical protein
MQGGFSAVPFGCVLVRVRIHEPTPPPLFKHEHKDRRKFLFAFLFCFLNSFPLWGHEKLEFRTRTNTHLVAKKSVLPVEVNACALRASQDVKRAEV